MKTKILLMSLLGLCLFWACHLGQDDDQKVFDVAGDSTWTELERLTIILVGDSGQVLDTLFDDSLHSLKELKTLSAKAYQGGKIDFQIRGYKGGKIVMEQTRHLQSGGKMRVDTALDWRALPQEMAMEPESLKLELGSAAADLQAIIRPGYADKSVAWKLLGEGVVDLDFGGAPVFTPRVKVHPKKAGEARIQVTSRKDSTKSATISIKVVYSRPASLRLDRHDLVLYQGGPGDLLEVELLPVTADQGVTWTSMDSSVASVDAQGRFSPRGPGTTYLLAVSPDLSLRDSATVVVKRDVPVLTIAPSKTQAPVHSTLIFSPSATQEFGTVVMYKWDLDGDGGWDDSMTGAWEGHSVNLPARSREYAKEGSYLAAFLVCDGEGNEARSQVQVQITNQAPLFLALRADTTISIKDSIPMTARISDPDGKVAGWAWDYDGDGTWDDSGKVSDSLVSISRGFRYLIPGPYKAVIKAIDGDGKITLDTVLITVLLDAPIADAGQDTTVLVGRMINIHAKGADGYGPIAKREMKIGSNPFIALSKQDTSILAPDTTSVLTVVVRVTDDDGLSAEDSMLVSVLYSPDANLSNLVLSIGVPNPAFNSGVLEYSAAVGYRDSIVKVTPTAADPTAKIMVNGLHLVSGLPSSPEKLKVGGNPNAFQILVTAQDGIAKKTYQVSLNRAPSSDASLSALKATLGANTKLDLNTTFSTSVFEYRDTVPHLESKIVFTPTAAHSDDVLSVDDSLVASGSATLPKPLAVGDNVFKISVTAQDGVTRITYTIMVVRLAKLILERRLGMNSASAPFDSMELPLSATRTVTAPAVIGFHFTSWSPSGGNPQISNSTLPSPVITITAGESRVRAEYDTNTYTLAVTGDGNGTVAPSGVQTVKHGVTIPIKATPSPGYVFVAWSVTGPVTLGSVDSAGTSATVTGNGAVLARFALKKFTITVIASHGSVTKFPDQASYDSGTSVQLTAKPDIGYRFSGWSGAVTDTAKSINLVMNGPKTLTALFQIKQYGITLITTPSGSGTIGKSLDQSLYDSGTTVQLTAKPGIIYNFSNWSGAVTGITNPINLLVNGNQTVTAVFQIKRSTLILGTNTTCIKICIDNNCGLNPSITADAGTVVTITAPSAYACSSSPSFFVRWLRVSGNSLILNPDSPNSSITIGTENSNINAEYQ